MNCSCACCSCTLPSGSLCSHRPPSFMEPVPRLQAPPIDPQCQPTCPLEGAFDKHISRSKVRDENINKMLRFQWGPMYQWLLHGGSPPSSDLHRNLAYWIHKSSEITSWSHILYLQLHSSYHCTFIHMFPFVCCVFYDWSLILMPKCAPDDQCSNSLQMRLVCVCLCVCGYVFDECGVNGEDLVHVDNPMLLQIVSD